MDYISEKRIAYLYPLRAYTSLRDEFLLHKEIISIGRHPSNDIVLPFNSVSRFHTRIEHHKDDFVLVDLRSSNGSFVNGKRVQTQTLEEGDTIALGEVELRFTKIPQSQRERRKKVEAESTVELVATPEDTAHSIVEKSIKADITPLLGEKVDLSDHDAIMRDYSRLVTLYRLAELLRGAHDEQAMLKSVMNLIFETLPAHRGVILTRFHEHATDFEPVLVKHRTEADSAKTIPISRTMVDRVVKDHIAVLSEDALRDERFADSESVVDFEIRSVMCVPLIVKNAVMGVIHVDAQQSSYIFGEADLAFLTSIANELAVSLDNLKLREEMIRTERMAAIGQTITNIAHSIKNILQLSKGGTALMDRNISSADLENIRSSWEIVRHSIERMSDLTNSMLDYSRPRKVLRKPCDINELIKEISDGFRETLAKKQIKVFLDLDFNISQRPLDTEGLRLVLENLIVNAVEAIQHENGAIVVTTYTNPANAIVVTVKDNGTGIPEDKIGKIFFPFFTTKGSQSTGLGLAMTKKIVEEMSGKIDIESKEGEGATFTITLQSDDTKITYGKDSGA
jgi:two-component system NtrC family sensor kinase